jgi:hypothetical protein
MFIVFTHNVVCHEQQAVLPNNFVFIESTPLGTRAWSINEVLLSSCPIQTELGTHCTQDLRHNCPVVSNTLNLRMSPALINVIACRFTHNTLNNSYRREKLCLLQIIQVINPNKSFNGCPCSSRYS